MGELAKEVKELAEQSLRRAGVRRCMGDGDEVEVVGKELLVGRGSVAQYPPPCLPKDTEDQFPGYEFLEKWRLGGPLWSRTTDLSLMSIPLQLSTLLLV